LQEVWAINTPCILAANSSSILLGLWEEAWDKDKIKLTRSKETKTKIKIRKMEEEEIRVKIKAKENR
jgi:hypothetical protein